MNQIKRKRIIQIIYPLLIYFTIYQVGAGFLISLYAEKIGRLMCLLIAAVVCILPIYAIYRNISGLTPVPVKNIKQIILYVLSIILIVAFGIVLNVLITRSGLINQSEGFSKANQTLSYGSMLIKILCNVIAIPILEEILMRGIIAGQVLLWHGQFAAVVTSAICFGIIHNNIVQFIYALLVGLALGFLFVKTKRLSLCFVAHGLINLIVILFS